MVSAENTARWPSGSPPSSRVQVAPPSRLRKILPRPRPATYQFDGQPVPVVMNTRSGLSGDSTMASG